MLDDRYYRDNHKEPPTDRSATMLGPAQKAWLFDAIKQSDATFKILVTSVPWAYGVKPGSQDPWQGFKEEREEIFSFLAKNSINGVFLLSGDRQERRPAAASGMCAAVAWSAAGTAAEH